jgi:hypothetical protein
MNNGEGPVVMVKCPLTGEAAGHRGDASGNNDTTMETAHADGNIHATHGNDHGDADFDIELDAAEEAVLGFLFIQVSMKRSLKLFGERGEAAIKA